MATREKNPTFYYSESWLKFYVLYLSGWLCYVSIMADQEPTICGIKGVLLSPRLKKSSKTELSKCIVCQRTLSGTPLTEASNEGKVTLKRAAELRVAAGEDEGILSS